jgi:hypothetical protein
LLDNKDPAGTRKDGLKKLEMRLMMSVLAFHRQPPERVLAQYAATALEMFNQADLKDPARILTAAYYTRSRAFMDLVSNTKGGKEMCDSTNKAANGLIGRDIGRLLDEKDNYRRIADKAYEENAELAREKAELARGMAELARENAKQQGIIGIIFRNPGLGLEKIAEMAGVEVSELKEILDKA